MRIMGSSVSCEISSRSSSTMPSTDLVGFNSFGFLFALAVDFPSEEEPAVAGAGDSSPFLPSQHHRPPSSVSSSSIISFPFHAL